MFKKRKAQKIANDIIDYFNILCSRYLNGEPLNYFELQSLLMFKSILETNRKERKK